VNEVYEPGRVCKTLGIEQEKMAQFVLWLLMLQSVMARLSGSDVPKSDDPRAPILLSSIGSKINHPLLLLLSKYGMTGTKKVKHSHQKDAKRQKLEKKGKGSSDDGWVYGTVYTGTTCAGTEYMTAGVKLGQCIPIYSSESFYFTCDSDTGYVTMNKYSDEDCSTLDESLYIVETGCGETSSWYTDDSISTENSVQISCSTSTTPPFEEDSTDYDVSEFFTSSSSSSCSSDDLSLYEAFPLDTCIPMDKSTYGYSGLEFEQSSSSPKLKYYTSSKTCSGTGISASLTTTCSSLYSGYDVYYKWVAWS